MRERFEHTGRNVPEKIVKATFDGLGASVPEYIRRQEELCDSLLLYDNDTRGARLAVSMRRGVGTRDATRDALALASRYFG